MSWKQKARALKTELKALVFAVQDPRVPRHLRILAGVIVAYAFSPLDLIPDFIPVLGYLDDLILIPAGIWILLKRIPPEVMIDCRRRAQTEKADVKTRWIAAAGVLLLQLMIAFLVIRLFLKRKVS